MPPGRTDTIEAGEEHDKTEKDDRSARAVYQPDRGSGNAVPGVSFPGAGLLFPAGSGNIHVHPFPVDSAKPAETRADGHPGHAPGNSWLHPGQLLISLAVSVLTAAGLFLVGLPAWLALGILMGFCEFIPYVGPFLGAITIALFTLPRGSAALLWAMAVTVGVQQLEGFFLSPFLMAGATGLHPVYVVLLLSAGGMIAGLPGMMLALPLFLCVRGGARILADSADG